MLPQKTLFGCLILIALLAGLPIPVTAGSLAGQTAVLQQATHASLAAAAPTPAPSATPVVLEKVRGQPPLSLTLMLGFTICALGLVVGVIILGMIAGAQRPKGEQAVDAGATEQGPSPKNPGSGKTKGRPAGSKRKK